MTESKKELIGYVKGCLSKGYSSGSIKKTLKKYGYESALAERAVDLCYKERNVSKLIIILALALVASAFLLLSPSFTGFFTMNFTAETPANESYLARAWLFVNVTTDIGDNETNITFYLYNSSFGLVENTTLGAGNRSNNFTSLAEGIYYYNVTVRNTSHENSTIARQVILDTTNPTAFDLDYPADNTASINLTPMLNWSNTSDTNFANFTLELSTSSSFSYSNYTFNTTNISHYLTDDLATDTTWYWRVTAQDKALNTRISSSAYIYKTDTTNVNIVNETYQPSNVYNNDTIQLNATITDANLDTVWVMSNETGNWTNTTIITSTGNVYYTTISSSELSNQETVGFEFYANDSAGSTNNGSLNSFRVKNRLPSIVTLDLPSNNSIKVYDTVYFNWSNSSDIDGDNFIFEVLVGTDIGFTGIDTNITNISNIYFNITGSGYNLSHSWKYWKARACDAYNCSNYSAYNNLDIIGSIIDITSPANYSIVYPGNITNIVVNEARNGEWVNNLTLTINNLNYTAEYSTDWEYSYTIPSITPTLLRITATGYNITFNPNLSVTHYIDLQLSKLNSSSPVIDYICSNETYVFNNSNVTIISRVSPDTLLNLSNFSITSPSGISSNYNFSSSSLSGLVYNYYYYNYTINETGNWSLSTYVKDIENNESTANYTFYSVGSSNTKQFTITGTNVTELRLKDVCSGNSLSTGTTITRTVPDTALYNVETVTDKPTITFNNANLTDTIDVLNYTLLAQNISAPSEKRIVLEFELLSDFASYDNVTLSYNYSSVESSLDDETSLLTYSCTSRASCAWEQINTTLDTANNLVSITMTNISSYSVFLIAETAVATIPVAVTAGGGGSAGAGEEVFFIKKTKAASLNILIPSKLSMLTEGVVKTPVTIINNGNTTLNNIYLELITNATNLSLVLVNRTISSLKIGESTNISLEIFSTNYSRLYEVMIMANVTTPELTEESRFYIEVVDKCFANITYIQSKIEFAQSLFKENPECLELNEIIKQAETQLNNNECEEAIYTIDSAINGCKELVTKLEKEISLRKEYYARRKISIRQIIIVAAVIMVISLLRLVWRKIRYRALLKQI